jgi:hypothetical protein
VGRLPTIFLCLALAASAEIIDRLAVTVDREAITELQLDEELRVTAFLNRKPIVRDLDTRRAAAARLVEQLIIRREMELSHYPLPGEQDLSQYFDQIRGEFRTSDEFDQALTRYGLTERALGDHLALQLTTLRFIEFRFQPEVDVSDTEIEAAYKREIATSNTAHSGVAPTFEALRSSIRKALIEERIDRALDTWLQERRRRVHVVYADASLQ